MSQGSRSSSSVQWCPHPPTRHSIWLRIFRKYLGMGCRSRFGWSRTNLHLQWQRCLGMFFIIITNVNSSIEFFMQHLVVRYKRPYASSEDLIFEFQNFLRSLIDSSRLSPQKAPSGSTERNPSIMSCINTN